MHQDLQLQLHSTVTELQMFLMHQLRHVLSKERLLLHCLCVPDWDPFDACQALPVPSKTSITMPMHVSSLSKKTAESIKSCMPANHLIYSASLEGEACCLNLQHMLQQFSQQHGNMYIWQLVILVLTFWMGLASCSQTA